MKRYLVVASAIFLGATAARAQSRFSAGLVPVRPVPIVAGSVPTQTLARPVAFTSSLTPIAMAQTVIPAAVGTPIPVPAQPQALADRELPTMVQTMAAAQEAADLAATEPAALDRFYTNAVATPALDQAPVPVASPMRRLKSGLTAAAALVASLPIQAAAAPAIAGPSSIGRNDVAEIAAGIAVFAALGALVGFAARDGKSRSQVLKEMALRGLFSALGVGMLTFSFALADSIYGRLWVTLIAFAGIVTVVVSLFGDT